ncbi:MAG: hypothetical protein ACLQMF_05845 [Rectinemataceae bacterium]
MPTSRLFSIVSTCSKKSPTPRPRSRPLALSSAWPPSSGLSAYPSTPSTPSKIPELRRSVVAFVDRIKSSLPLASILKLLGLSYSRFHSWATNARPCLSSPLDRCRRSYPNQLTPSELRAIRKAFLNPDYSHWPASSIAWHLVNSNIVCAHVCTITRYAKLLGLYNAHLPHRSRKRGSLSAASPNQAWHMDVTILRTMDNQKAFLQLILDNCSHKIIAWKDSLAISGLNSMELLRSAFFILDHDALREHQPHRRWRKREQ